jgi:type II secretory pathway pseudopilin PulG
MLEAIANVVVSIVSIGGTLLAVWLGSRLEKNREKEQERQKQKSTITQLYREISDKITILNEIRDKIVDP